MIAITSRSALPSALYNCVILSLCLSQSSRVIEGEAIPQHNHQHKYIFSQAVNTGNFSINDVRGKDILVMISQNGVHKIVNLSDARQPLPTMIDLRKLAVQGSRVIYRAMYSIMLAARLCIWLTLAVDVQMEHE